MKSLSILEIYSLQLIRSASQKTDLSFPIFFNGGRKYASIDYPDLAALATWKYYTKDDSIKSASVVWSPCGANGTLNVNNPISLTVNSPNATGELLDDDAAIAFTQQLNLQWATCNTT